jgi:predicted CoA-substrate-specific enzyme activase
MVKPSEADHGANAVKSMGICIGSSNISVVLVGQNNGHAEVLSTRTFSHEGNPRRALISGLSGELLSKADFLAVTGRNSRDHLRAAFIAEPEAIECAYSAMRGVYPGVDTVMSAGAETFMAYQLDRSGRVCNVQTGNKCASGTGSFFLQQIKRLNLTVEDVQTRADLSHPYQVAGRCSVFCKSDCTHALNKGVPKEQVVAGLCRMMAEKMKELLYKTRSQHALIIGGVAANKHVLHFLNHNSRKLNVPDHADCFEALGAALWAMNRSRRQIDRPGELLLEGARKFDFLPPLSDFTPRVTCHRPNWKSPADGDHCILGVDVGSTTTKAVVMRMSDHAILAGCYLRTNGDPVGASRECYRKLDKQLKEALGTGQVVLKGLGVTGSGRQIAGLHALSPAIINEIIAHARAATYYDAGVDTILEIGGQDAKYTYLINGVPADYAMNEACSAGTGSFLEEAARETLSIVTEDIGNLALKSSRPPNFNDQCSAFISSDIKRAIQEGTSGEDLAAGLVYSVCLNYINRVKGNRKIGQKVFMQGGVCYNPAVPAAMAAITGKDIIVPPDPGLMGAFGVALEVQMQLDLGSLPAMTFDLAELAAREVRYAEPFTCRGEGDECDRKCSINIISIKGRKHPFGGACNKYANIHARETGQGPQVHGIGHTLDIVSLRERLVTQVYSRERVPSVLPERKTKVGLNLSLLAHTFYPLFFNFFRVMGFEVVTGETVDKAGLERRGAEFCYPVENSHGTMLNLINQSPDVYFLPQIATIHATRVLGGNQTCPLVQAEPHYLKAAFKELENKTVYSPVLSFAGGYRAEKKAFLDMARSLGVRRGQAARAFEEAVTVQEEMEAHFGREGRAFLQQLALNPSDIGIVLFGRPYNAFTSMANMGIPRKFTSRGFRIISHDFLPFRELDDVPSMYWGQGQMLLKAAKFVRQHPQLFPVFISNFSCGPDSFILSFFRSILEDKPSLTLELDSHTADAGVDTRIEAFLDIIKGYQKVTEAPKHRSTGLIANPGGQECPRSEKSTCGSHAGVRTFRSAPPATFRPAEITLIDNEAWVIDSQGRKRSLKDPDVHVLVPSMGDMAANLLAAVFRHMGIRATAAEPPGAKELRLGKSLVSCKECLPFVLTVGSLMRYLEERGNRDEVLVFFMPKATGPCRFGQYSVLLKQIIEKMRCENVALISLSSQNSYAGLGSRFSLRAWQAAVIADVLEEINSAVLTTCSDKEQAQRVYNNVCRSILDTVGSSRECGTSSASDSWRKLKGTLRLAAAELNKLRRKQSLAETPKVALVGEIYVRRDELSRQSLVERFADAGVMVKTAPVSEWLYYCDYLARHNLLPGTKLKDRFRAVTGRLVKRHFEREIKEILSESGLYELQMVDVDKVIRSTSGLISPRLTGEAILTTGLALKEIAETAAGVISIGPFGCMPCRIAESLLSTSIQEKKLLIAEDKEMVSRVMKEFPNLPYLAIETDGNPFPQLIEAKLDIFLLQVKRVHEVMFNPLATRSC